MANDNFEKRMEFLKKSYERVPSSFDPDEVFRNIDEEGKRQPPEQKRATKNGMRQHITVWAVSIASVFIIGLIAAGFLTEQEKNTDESIIDSAELDEYIEELKANYEVEKEKRREMLKLDEKHFELYAGSSSMSILSFESYVNSIKQDGNGKKRLSELYDQAIEELKLPSEMIQDLKSNPLTEDETGSIEFLATYRKKVTSLIAIYNQIIDENSEAIRAFEVSSSSDKAETMMLTSKSFPEQLQNIINTMKEQSIRLESEKYTGDIGARYYDSQLHQGLDANLHANTYGYRRMLIDTPYMFGGVLEHPLLQSSSMLQDMEYTLMNVEEDPTLYPILKSYYSTLFNEIMKGSEYTKLFDADGVLLPEYQEAWRNMAGGGQATPMRYILNPIIKEMEASGWRESASWDSLTYYDLEEALVLFREGKLEEYMYGERPDFQDVAIQLPNDSFEKEVQALYTDFKETYDKTVLKGVSPIHVLKVFDYANEREDPLTMYHLINENILKYDESGIDYTPEYYVGKWRKGISYFWNATEVRFDGQAVFRDSHNFHSDVRFTGVDWQIPMVFTEEGVWEVGIKSMNDLPLYHMNPEMDFQDEIMSMSAYYYEGLVSTDDIGSYLRWSDALEILGMYFYAGSKEFYGMQYELFYQAEEAEVVDRETYVDNAEKYFLPYDENMYQKVSFQGLEQDENGNWPGIATLTVNTELYPDLPPERKFHMFWGKDGWRVKFNPLEQ